MMKCPSNASARLVRSCRGFTLVELLVVIAIIAILVSILMPALGRARESSNRVQCASNMRQMGLAFMMYDQDHGEMPPGNWDEANIIRGGVHILLRDRYKLSQALTFCPSAARPYANDSPYPSDATYKRRWDQDFSEGKMTYHYLAGDGGRAPGSAAIVVNGWLCNGGYWPLYYRGIVPQLRYSKARRASDMPYMFDLAYFNDPAITQHKPQVSNHRRRGSTNEAVGENVMYYDNHVEWHEIGPESVQFGRDFREVIYWSPTVPLK